MLRNGNVDSPDDWKSFLDPIIKRYQDKDLTHYFRGDAAFANPDSYHLLETEGYSYAIRLKGNNILQNHIEHLLTRPVGRPQKKPVVQYHSFQYQAVSWQKPRRVVAKVEWHADELFPRVGFIVTNLRWKRKILIVQVEFGKIISIKDRIMFYEILAKIHCLKPVSIRYG